MNTLFKKASEFEKLAGKGILLQRVGGLTPVKQTNNRAPEKYGVWAFIFPYAEIFFLGSTNPEGVSKPGSTNNRAEQLKREGWTRFRHHGRIWTRIPDVRHSKVKNGWYLTDADTLNDYISVFIAKLTKEIKTTYDPNFPVGANPHRWFAKDHMEVFVPDPQERDY